MTYINMYVKQAFKDLACRVNLHSRPPAVVMGIVSQNQLYRFSELSIYRMGCGLVSIPWHPLILVLILNELGLTYRLWHSHRFYVSFIGIVLNFVDIISNYIDIVYNSITARYPSLDGRQAPPRRLFHRTALLYIPYICRRNVCPTFPCHRRRQHRPKPQT